MARTDNFEDRTDFAALAQFTELFLSHARDYAREGKKDFARDVVRFLRNGRVLQILKRHTPGDVAKLERDLNTLAGECHPLDVPNFASDLRAIRSTLDRLLDLAAAPAPRTVVIYTNPQATIAGAGAGREAPAPAPSLSLTNNSAKRSYQKDTR